MAKKNTGNKVLLGDVKDFEESDEPVNKKNSSKSKNPNGFFSFLSDERFLKSLGITFILFSFFLLIAGISFLFTWQADQSLVKNMSFGYFQISTETVAKNALGNLGAWLGFIFIYKGFGVASFAICIIFFSIGFYLLTKLQPIPIIKTLKYSFFSTIWLSLVFGLIFNQTYQIIGGVFGHFGIINLKIIIGDIGTVLFLISYILIFAVALFNIEFYQPNFKLKSEHLFEPNLSNSQAEVSFKNSNKENTVNG